MSSRAVLSALLMVGLVACEAKKSSNPLSPSVAGPIAGVEITAPRLLEPAQGFKFKESQQPIRLVIENASTNGVRTVFYHFEVATDQNFETKVFARSSVPAGDGGRTSVMVDRLQEGRAYYWRARGDDGANASTFSTANFEVLPKPQLGMPRLVSPAGNERVTSNRPTLTVGIADRNAAVGRVSYQFQIATDIAFGNVVASGVEEEDGSQTDFTPGNSLTSNTQYFWRARASDGETNSSWATAESFRTPLATAPAPSPAPGPGGGGSCASNNGPAIVACIEAKYPDRVVAGVSHNQRVANMEFLRDRIIEAGLCGGMDLAWNLKRGVGPRSTDAIAWRTGGRVEVVDIGVAFDDTSIPLRLSWGIVEGPPGYDPYPRPNCQ
jgi:hypothetical protein